MINRHQNICLDIHQAINLCLNHPDTVHYTAMNNELPEHWQTQEGKILWLHGKPSENDEELSVRLATPAELMSDPEIMKGAVAFTSHIKQYQQQLKERSAKKLPDEQKYWMPTVSNQAQKEDLAFGGQIEAYLLQLNQHIFPPKKISAKIRGWCKTTCLCIEEKQIHITEAKFIWPTASIRAFRKCFNRMVQRRINLLNPILERNQLPMIGYIPLGFESDCSPRRVTKKVTLLKEVEEMSLIALLAKEINILVEDLQKAPHHIPDLIKPIAEITQLWMQIWPDNKEQIINKVMLQLQVLRLHPELARNQPRVEGILRKIRNLLCSVTK